MTTDDTTQEAPRMLPAIEGAPATIEALTEAEDARGNKEAAKYRRQLREAEAERDTLTERVAALQRAEAERIAGEKIAQPSALWASGVTLDTLLDADGNVDAGKVREATDAATSVLGLTKTLRGPILPNQGKHPDRAVTRDTFEAAFSPDRGH